MTDGFSIANLEPVAASWDVARDDMADTSRTLAGLEPGVAPSLEGSARAFLTAWSGFAGESRDMADGYAEALRQSSTFYVATDDASRDAVERLDGRLGPAR